MIGAGDGNRTHVASLEGWNSTIELHPHKAYTQRLKMISQSEKKVNNFSRYIKTILGISCPFSTVTLQ